jgi:hypothetical protein
MDGVRDAVADGIPSPFAAAFGLDDDNDEVERETDGGVVVAGLPLFGDTDGIGDGDGVVIAGLSRSPEGDAFGASFWVNVGGGNGSGSLAVGGDGDAFKSLRYNNNMPTKSTYFIIYHIIKEGCCLGGGLTRCSSPITAAIRANIASVAASWGAGVVGAAGDGGGGGVTASVGVATAALVAIGASLCSLSTSNNKPFINQSICFE